jgi:hypothetical protein
VSRPIAQAAVSTSYFEKPRLHRSRAETRPSDALRSQAGDLYDAVRITTAVRNYTIRNAVLDSVTGLLHQDEHEIPETSYFPPEGGLQAQSAGLVRLDDSEDIVIGYNNAHGSYQHWLTQCVPAIDWSLRQRRTRSVRLVLPALAAWQSDILALLGYSQIPRLTLKPNTRYLLPHAEYSEFLNGTASFGVCLMVRDTARRILDRLPSAESPHPILFVPCSNPYYGIIRNEAEIIRLLRRHGVHVVDQRLSTAERINLFRHADVVIGPLGQGLADVLFCKPGALLWEWIPRHHQNASINRLAQAAQVDYWGDLFESSPASGASRQWVVDLDAVDRRLSEISERPAVRGRRIGGTSPPASTYAAASRPIGELMLAFENLGDNCEFGLVQRNAGVEPLGLLRFAGTSLEMLVAALQTKFSGLGTIDTVTVYLEGKEGRREFMVHETSLDTRYHTFFHEGDVDAEELRRREAKRLGFLREKLLADLAVGEKIWVWRELRRTDPARLQPLLNALRNLGPNILLWVVAADDDHPAGSAELIERDFIKGYVERLVSYRNATDILPDSWFDVCDNAYSLCRPDQVQPEPGEAPELDEVSALDEASVLDEPIVVPPPRALSAMEFLAFNQATLQSAPPARSDRKAWFARLRQSLGL